MKLRLKELRKERGWTQREIANAAEMSVSYYAELERGAKQVNQRRMEELAKVLGVGLSDLFHLEQRQFSAANLTLIRRLKELQLSADDLLLLERINELDHSDRSLVEELVVRLRRSFGETRDTV